MIGRIRKLAALPASRQRLLFWAWVVLAAVRVRLWLFRLQPKIYHRSLTGCPLGPALKPRCYRAATVGSGPNLFNEPPARATSGYDPQEIAWAIELAGRFVPRATCLVKALAAQSVLASWGHPSRLLLGVAPSQRAGRSLEAHAWVECEGQVLIGGDDLERYHRILVIGQASPAP